MTVWHLCGRLPSWSHMPQRKEALDLRQAPAANRCRRPTPVHQCLKVTFEMYRPNTIVHLRVTLVVPFVSTARPLIRRPRPASAS